MSNARLDIAKKRVDFDAPLFRTTRVLDIPHGSKNLARLNGLLRQGISFYARGLKRRREPARPMELIAENGGSAGVS
jgi:hypothetical protein